VQGYAVRVFAFWVQGYAVRVFAFMQCVSLLSTNLKKGLRRCINITHHLVRRDWYSNQRTKHRQ
jgi:hypothetical protein